MKVIFLDFDGVLNSRQSMSFWHRKRDQEKWENQMYESWQGTMSEYIAQEFCPICTSNMELLIEKVPEAKIVVSSTWRLNNTVDDLKKILKPFPTVANRIIGVTPRGEYKNGRIMRGEEIKTWLEHHPEVENYVIIDDDSDMLPEQLDNFVHTSNMHGFLYGDMLKATNILRKDEE